MYSMSELYNAGWLGRKAQDFGLKDTKNGWLLIWSTGEEMKSRLGFTLIYQTLHGITLRLHTHLVDRLRMK